MSLLPSKFQRTDPMLMTLGAKIVAPAPEKVDPIAAFETGAHLHSGEVVELWLEKQYLQRPVAAHPALGAPYGQGRAAVEAAAVAEVRRFATEYAGGPTLDYLLEMGKAIVTFAAAPATTGDHKVKPKPLTPSRWVTNDIETQVGVDPANLGADLTHVEARAIGFKEPAAGREDSSYKLASELLDTCRRRGIPFWKAKQVMVEAGFVKLTEATVFQLGAAIPGLSALLAGYKRSTVNEMLRPNRPKAINPNTWEPAGPAGLTDVSSSCFVNKTANEVVLCQEHVAENQFKLTATARYRKY